MATYPLLFSFHDVVAGSGFWAGVVKDGRALLVEDEESSWFYGVDPGSVAGNGSTAQEAHQDFRAGYRSVLADFADEADDFETFKALAMDFLSAVNVPNEVLWEEAVKDADSADRPDWLPKRSAKLDRRLEVVELQEPRETINDPSSQSEILAAA